MNIIETIGGRPFNPASRDDRELENAVIGMLAGAEWRHAAEVAGAKDVEDALKIAYSLLGPTNFTVGYHVVLSMKNQLEDRAGMYHDPTDPNLIGHGSCFDIDPKYARLREDFGAAVGLEARAEVIRTFVESNDREQMTVRAAAIERNPTLFSAVAKYFAE